MKKISFSVAAAAIALAATVAPAQAQDAIEFGVDGGLMVSTSSPRITALSIPAGNFRVGFHLSPSLSVEPALGLNHLSVGGESLTAYSLDLGVLYHFSPMAAGNSIYVRPFAGLEGFSASEADGSTELNAGLGVGIKLPLVDRLFARFEANGRYFFDQEETVLGLTAGLSFLTR